MTSSYSALKFKIILKQALILICYVSLSSFGIFLIKTAEFTYSIYFFIGVFIYLCGSVIWLAMLRILPLSIAFPVASGLMILSTTFVGWVFLYEEVGLFQMIGSVAILFGIWLVKK